jgi:DNA-binding MarR family transcriptional regulator
VSTEFLRKLYEMSAGDYEIIDKYKVGDQLGITNSQTDDAVENLDKMGLIKKNRSEQNSFVIRS